MNRTKLWVRRLVMSILFCSAVLTSFQTISGVEARTLTSWWHEHYMKYEETKKPYTEHSIKSVQLSFKQLKTRTVSNLQISSSVPVTSEPPSLEQSVDWSQYQKKQVVATGYTAGYESTGKNPNHPSYGITYSGVKVKRDLFSTIAADLNVFPIGTVLFIPGYGYGVVADKGGAIKGNRLDLYYETVGDVYKHWGKKTIDVYIVELGDGSLTEADLIALNENESMQVFRQQYIRTERE